MILNISDDDLDLIGELFNAAPIGKFGPAWLRLMEQIRQHNEAQMAEAEHIVQKRIHEAVKNATALNPAEV